MTKRLKNSLVSIVFITFVSATALWQAQITAKKNLNSRNQPPPLPLKTRHAIRPIARPWSGDPVADYVVRCEKGLTEREIGWIIEDFKTAGLDEGSHVASHPKLLSQRAAQHRWYHDALVDGLRLTPQQSADVAEKLEELFDDARVNFIKALNPEPNPPEHDGPWFETIGTEPIDNLVLASRWLLEDSGTFMPWNLCTLTPEQQKITRKSWFSRPLNEQPGQELLPPTDEEGLSFLLPQASFPDEYRHGELVPSKFLTSNAVLPFLIQQEFKMPAEASAGPSIEELTAHAKTLHPAQFKILLLFEPTIAGQVEQALSATEPWLLAD